ncbi:MAG TPA: ATP-binding protein [Smithella sp.]|nr:ATP-binding protein [Smithella sp.]
MDDITSQVLRMSERIDIAISIGESHFREFKSAFEGPPSEKKPRPPSDICCDIAEALVAFANGDGGEVIIGVENDSTITGVPHKDEDNQMMLNAYKTHIHNSTPLKDIKHYKVNYKEFVILYFQVLKSSDTIYLTSDGKCLQRKDMETVPIAPHAITLARQEEKSRKYDREYVDNANLNDLDIDIIKFIANDVSKGLSPEKLLQHLDLAEYTPNGLKIRRAALLLFAKSISKWHPRSQVRFVKVMGTQLKSGVDYNANELGIVQGNIISLMNDTWEKLRPFLVQTKLSSGAIFEKKIMYPEQACQEAIINTIAHRDYSMEGSGIEIFIYEDRLEFKNPGSLLSTISIEKIMELKGAHESRNALIGRTLRERGFMRELGEGMRRIFELFKKNELSPPVLSTDNYNFTLTLHHKSIYTTEQKLWLEQFENDDLTPEEKSVVLLGYNNNIFSAQDIWDTVGIVDTEDYRKLVKSLQVKGILAGKHGNADRAKVQAKRARIPFRKFKRYYIIKPELRGQARKEIQKETDLGIEPDYEKSRIYVTNFPYSINPDDLYEIFQTAGSIIDIHVPINYETGRPRGYAFIAYEEDNDAQIAIRKHNNSMLGGRRIAVSLALKHKKNDGSGSI